MPTYAITGASGQLGRLAVHELLARGVPASDVVAIVRTPSRATDLTDRGAQVREANYASPQALGAALLGVDRLLLISSSEAGQRVAHHTNVIQAATTAGTARIAYTSMLNADDTTNPLAREHKDTEHALRAAGVPFEILGAAAGARLTRSERTPIGGVSMRLAHPLRTPDDRFVGLLTSRLNRTTSTLSPRTSELGPGRSINPPQADGRDELEGRSAKAVIRGPRL